MSLSEHDVRWQLCSKHVEQTWFQVPKSRFATVESLLGYYICFPILSSILLVATPKVDAIPNSF